MVVWVCYSTTRPGYDIHTSPWDFDGPNRNRWSTPFLIAWWIFPWRTVNVITRPGIPYINQWYINQWYIYIYTIYYHILTITSPWFTGILVLIKPMERVNSDSNELKPNVTGPNHCFASSSSQRLSLKIDDYTYTHRIHVCYIW